MLLHLFPVRAQYLDENKQVMRGLLEQLDLFLDRVLPDTNALATQMIFGVLTITIDDPKLEQLFRSVEKFCAVTSTTLTALFNPCPVLKRLPAGFHAST